MHPSAAAGDAYVPVLVHDLRPGDTLELDGTRQTFDHVEPCNSGVGVIHFTDGTHRLTEAAEEVTTVTRRGIPAPAKPEGRSVGALVHYWNGARMPSPGVLMDCAALLPGDVIATHGNQVAVTSVTRHGVTIEVRGRIAHTGPEHIARHDAGVLTPVLVRPGDTPNALVARALVNPARTLTLRAFEPLTVADPARALDTASLLLDMVLPSWRIDADGSASSQHFIDTGRRLTVAGEDSGDGAQHMARIARAAFAALVDLDPTEAYRVVEEHRCAIRADATFPQVREATGCAVHDGVWGEDPTCETCTFEGIPIDPQGADPANQSVILIDPYTDQPTTLISVDVSDRWTYEDEPGERDGSTVRFDWDERADYHDYVLLADGSNLPVSLPDEWDTGSRF